MKETASRKTRFLAMLLCVLMFMQSFSYIVPLDISIPINAAEKPITLHFDVGEDGKNHYYTNYGNKTDYKSSTGTVYTSLRSIINHLYDMKYTSITIYMHTAYETTGTTSLSTSTFDGHGITTLIRANDYVAARDTDGDVVLNGYNGAGGALLIFKKNELALKNIIIDGGSGGVGTGVDDTVTPGIVASSAAVVITDGGTLHLYEGAVIRNNFNVAVPKLYGSRNQLNANGGGVFVDADTSVTENNGVKTYKKVSSNLILHKGSTIEYNAASGSRRGFGGGGVFSLGKVEMDPGSVIRYNRASVGVNIRKLSGGGGIMLFSGEGRTVNDENTNEQNNQGDNSNGGWRTGYDYTPATLIMHGGEIYGNVAENGAGIFSVGEYIDQEIINENKANYPILDGAPVNNAYVQIEEGSLIYDNIATRSGGGIYMGEESKLIMNGGQIYSNDCTLKKAGEGANEFCGGVYFNGILMEYHGGSIYDNTSQLRADFYYYSNSLMKELTLNDIKMCMYGENVGWLSYNTNPMNEFVQISVDLSTVIPDYEPGQTIKIEKLKTSISTYTGTETLVDFYTDSSGVLYLWLQDGEFVESLTLASGEVIENPADDRTRVSIHYDYLGLKRKLCAKLENPPEDVDITKLEYKWRYLDANGDWQAFANNSTLQIFPLDQERYFDKKIVKKVRVTVRYLDATGVYQEWQSDELVLEKTWDETTNAPIANMPDPGVERYVRQGAVFERFFTGYDDITIAKHGISIPTNGAFTIHYEFQYFAFNNFKILMYYREDTTKPDNSSNGTALPAGTRVIFSDVCCCGETENTAKEYSHDTYGDVYYHVMSGEGKFIDMSFFKREGNPGVGYMQNTEITDRENNCVGFSRYQLTVILPEDFKTEAMFSVCLVKDDNQYDRISNSTTHIESKLEVGSAQISPVNDTVQDGVSYYPHESGVTLNVTTTEGTATIIEANEEFPYGTVVTAGTQSAVVNGKYALFDGMLSGQDVQIVGLRDDVEYTFKAYSSSADDYVDPMKTVDIMAVSEPTAIVMLTKDRIKPTMRLESGQKESDIRFVPVGQGRTFTFDIATTGMGVTTAGLVEAETRVKDSSKAYVATDAFSATVNGREVTVTVNNATPVGTYRIVFKYGTATYNYNIIVHK